MTRFNAIIENTDIDNKGDDELNTLNKPYVALIGLSGDKPCRLNMTLSSKMKPGNSQLCRKINMSLLVDGVLS